MIGFYGWCRNSTSGITWPAKRIGSMKRIYVAGPYSADNVIDVLDNMRRGIRLATKVLLAGMAPFAPWLDYHYQLALKEGECLKVADYYKYSLAWLDAADAVVVVCLGYRSSAGTMAEIERAEKLGIPVFYSFEELLKWKIS